MDCGHLISAGSTVCILYSSNLRLCLAIEIIFTHLSIDFSDFYRAGVPGDTQGNVGVLPAP